MGTFAQALIKEADDIPLMFVYKCSYMLVLRVG